MTSATGNLPLLPDPIVAFTGPFGSGKTEVAISYSLAALSAGRRPHIVDLDIVTPYFRVGDCRDELAAEGLDVIAPAGALASFELPSLPPEIGAALGEEEGPVVLDVGGDAVGARLLGVYARDIAQRGYSMWLVVNPYRPSCSSSAIVEHAASIESSSGLRLTGIVGNPNLGRVTRAADVQAGLEEVRSSAGGLGLPIVFVAVRSSLLDQIEPPGVPVLPLDLVLRLPWEAD